MWIDWQEWNVSVARMALEVQRLVPDAMLRFDFLGEGWGCSICPPTLNFEGTDEAEVYGEGLTPRSALEHALEMLQTIAA